MAAETNIKFFTSDNLNIPPLTATWGAMTTMLDAVLVDGLALPTISTITGDGSTITITFSSVHQLVQFQVIQLTGFTPASLNRNYRVMTIASTTAITVSGTETSFTTVGTAKMPPLGLEKTFTGTNKRVYRNADTTAIFRPYLRVDDSLTDGWNTDYTKSAKVGVLDTCSSIDDISGAQMPYSTDDQSRNWTVSGTGTAAINGWAKWVYGRSVGTTSANYESATPTAGNRRFVVVGDNTAFYIYTAHVPNDNTYTCYGFGVYTKYPTATVSPYFLISSNNRSSASTSVGYYDSTTIAFTNGTAADSNILTFNTIGNTNYQTTALASTSTNSGSSNTYSNTFVAGRIPMAAGGYLVGEFPHLRFIYKSRSESRYSVAAYDNIMYLIHQIQLNSGSQQRWAINLGSL